MWEEVHMSPGNLDLSTLQQYLPDEVLQAVQGLLYGRETPLGKPQRVRAGA